MSHPYVTKAVAKKLKYYFDVKRLEDGFDMSGPYTPQMDHPPLKARPTLMYDGLHDKPVKHYFSHAKVKQAITNMLQSDDEDGSTRLAKRNKEIKRQIKKQMKIHKFGSRQSKQRFGAQNNSLIKTNGLYKGGYPLVRAAPPDKLGRDESKRLVNATTQILVSTELFDLGANGKRVQDTKHQGLPSLAAFNQDSQDKFQTRPKSAESPKRLPKWAWNLDGRRIPINRKSYDDSFLTTDSAYSSRKNSAPESRTIPSWLRSQDDVADNTNDARGITNKWVYETDKPPSADEDHQRVDLRVPVVRRRPLSAKYRNRSSDNLGKARQDGSSSESSDSEQENVLEDHHQVDNKYSGRADELSLPTASDQSDMSDSDSHSKDSDFFNRPKTPVPTVRRQAPIDDVNITSVATQTDRSLLVKYDDTEPFVVSGEECTYKVFVRTGSRIGSGTKADVSIILYGRQGRSQTLYLDKSEQHRIKFLRQSEDLFIIKTLHVGPLEKIRIGHLQQEMEMSWFLDGVTIHDCRDEKAYEFPCNRWLSAFDGDMQTMVVFPVSTIRDLPKADTELQSNHSADQTEEVDDHSSNKSVTHEADSTSGTSVKANESDDNQTSRSKTSHKDDAGSSSDTKSESTNSSKKDASSSQSKNHSLQMEHEDSTALAEHYVNNEKKPVGDHLKNADDFESDAPQFSADEEKLETGSELESGKSAIMTFKQEDISSSIVEKSNENISVGEVDENADTDSHIDKSTLSDVKQPEETSLESEKDVDDKRSVEEVNKPEFADGFKAGMDAAMKQKALEKSQSSDSIIKEESVESKLPKGMGIHQAVKVKDVDRVKALLAHSPLAIDKKDERGWTPLHIAASNGALDLLRLLCITGADLKCETPTGYSALHLSALSGHVGCLMVLVGMGANIQCKSIDGQTPLHLAAQRGHLETCKWLVANRCPLEAKDVMQRSALDYADEYDHNEAQEFLSTCIDELHNPKSSFAMIRTSKRRSITSLQTTDGTTDDESEATSTRGGASNNAETGDDLTEDNGDTDDEDTDAWDDDENKRKQTSAADSDETETDDETDEDDDVDESEATENRDETETEENESGNEEEAETTDVEPEPDKNKIKDLKEKKKIYKEQHRKMVRTGSSFLDSVRDDYEEEDTVKE